MMSLEKRYEIIKKYAELMMNELEEIDPQIFILVYDTKDKYVSHGGLGCMACLREVLPYMYKQILNEPHTNPNKNSSPSTN